MIIKSENIDSALYSVVRDSQYFCPVFYPFFSVMYSTGVRAVEVANLERWEILTDDYVKLVTAKKNEDRLFEVKNIEPLFIKLVASQNSSIMSPSYTQLSYTFKKLFIYNEVYVGSKRSGLHLFRHNYAKQLVNKGYSTKEIQRKLGERKESSALSYISSVYSLAPYTLK